MRRLALTLALAALIAGVLAGPAAAWKHVFQDFGLSGQGSAQAFRAVAKKCKGGKIGWYDFVGRASVISQSLELHYEVKADLPVFAKFRQLRKVEFKVDTSGNFDPNVTAEIARAYAEFYGRTRARYVARKNRIIFLHQGIVLFGNQVLAPGRHAEPFKPKQGC